MMNTHELKTWPRYYRQVERGDKTFEVRRDDRWFCVGDTLVLHEYDPDMCKHTGRSLTKTVTSVLRGGQFGIETGYVVMSLADLT